MEKRVYDRFIRGFVMGRPEDCWEWTGKPMASGYGQFRIGGRGGMHYLAHRVALEVKLGRELQEGAFACHHCDNPICVNPAHLYEGTPQSNARDAVDRDRTHRKVSKEKAAEARRRHWEGGESSIDLAAELGVSRNTMSRTLNGKQWRTAEGPTEGRNATRKLTDEEVVAIRCRYAAGETNKSALARDFSVDVSNIRQILFGRIKRRAGGPIADPMQGKDRYGIGQRNPASKLTDEQVATIRSRRASGEKAADLAIEYEVHPMTVSRIVSGRSR